MTQNYSRVVHKLGNIPWPCDRDCVCKTTQPYRHVVDRQWMPLWSCHCTWFWTSQTAWWIQPGSERRRPHVLLRLWTEPRSPAGRARGFLFWVLCTGQMGERMMHVWVCWKHDTLCACVCGEDHNVCVCARVCMHERLRLWAEPGGVAVEMRYENVCYIYIRLHCVAVETQRGRSRKRRG